MSDQDEFRGETRHTNLVFSCKCFTPAHCVKTYHFHFIPFCYHFHTLPVTDASHSLTWLNLAERLAIGAALRFYAADARLADVQ